MATAAAATATDTAPPTITAAAAAATTTTTTDAAPPVATEGTGPESDPSDEVKRLQPLAFVTENAPRFLNHKQLQRKLLEVGVKGVSVLKRKNDKYAIFQFEDEKSRNEAFELLKSKKIKGNKMECRKFETKDVRNKRKRESRGKDGNNPKKLKSNQNSYVIIDGVWETASIGAGQQCRLAGNVGDAIHVKERGSKWIRFGVDGSMTTYECNMKTHKPPVANITVRPNSKKPTRDNLLGTVLADKAGEIVIHLNQEARPDLDRPPEPTRAALAEADNTIKCDQKDGGSTSVSKEGSPSWTRSVMHRTKDARNVITPLWRLSYEKQLQVKFHDARTIIKKLARQLTKMYVDTDGKKIPRGGGRLADLEDIGPSPVQDGYRNKCEFGAGLCAQSGKPLFGSTVGSVSQRVQDGVKGLFEGEGSGCVLVADPSKCPNLPAPAIDAAREMTTMMRNSGCKVYDRMNETGVFRGLLVRSSGSTKEVGIQLLIKSEGLENAKVDTIRQGFRTTCESLNKLWAEDKASENQSYRIFSATLKHFNGSSEVADKTAWTEPLFGPGFIHESLMNLKFRVSPEAFFQVNVRAAEKLFTVARQWLMHPSPAQPSVFTMNSALAHNKMQTEDAKHGESALSSEAEAKPIVLDVCCGTGAIGLLLADVAKKVIGLELVEEAVQDARRNAKLNGIDNVEYHVGKAEDTIKKVIRGLEQEKNYSEIIAVVDPPRAGLHSRVLKTLRNCSGLNHILYISCNAKSMMEDVKNLVQPCTRQKRGAPFRAVRVKPFDLFPHTMHFEMIMLLTRDHSRTERLVIKDDK
mmetsp:Transcript_14962/g.36633  ORF Transcript_14962/g.36633 Transcript_14962/m.36633 type:complete len:807 (-) Transcript_14962:435-2855(-)